MKTITDMLAVTVMEVISEGTWRVLRAVEGILALDIITTTTTTTTTRIRMI